MTDTWTRRSYAALVALSIAGYPLVSALPLVLHVDNRLVSVPYRALILLFSLILIAQVSLAGGRRYRGVFWFPFLAFWLFFAIRLLLDTVLFPVPLRLSGVEYAAYGIGMCMITPAALLVRFDGRTLELALWMTLGLAAAAMIVALYVNVLAIMRGDLESLQNMRLASETLNPIALGNIGVTVAVLSLFQLLRTSRPGIPAALSLLALLVLGLLTTGLAASRGPALALMLALPFLVWMGIRQRAHTRAILLGSAVVVFSVAAAVYVQQTLGFGIISRIESALSYEGDNSAETRVRLLDDAWSQFLESPVLGHSIDERHSRYHPHNPLVEGFMATGAFGGTAFALCMFIGLAGALVVMWRWPPLAWVSILYGQYLLNALVSGSLYLSADMWSLMAICVVLAFGERSTRASRQPVLESA